MILIFAAFGTAKCPLTWDFHGNECVRGEVTAVKILTGTLLSWPFLRISLTQSGTVDCAGFQLHLPFYGKYQQGFFFMAGGLFLI